MFKQRQVSRIIFPLYNIDKQPRAGLSKNNQVRWNV
jgi:hypothetical protein